MNSRWGLEHNIDFVAASFVRKPSDVTEIREYMTDLLHAANPGSESVVVPKIVSKIESIEALENFDEILAVSDAIMIARGDLAVEIPMETLTDVQKELVHRTNLAGIHYNHTFTMIRILSL